MPAESLVGAMGDINNDYAIDAVDALQALRHAVNQINLEGEAFTRANVTNEDELNAVNALDALEILKKSVGMDCCF